MTLDPTIEEIASIAAAPLSSDGSDARDGEAFDQLQGQMDQLQREGPSVMDWGLVATRGLEFLGHESKDILVAAWSAHALYRDRGIRGLAGGLGLLRSLIADHWPQLYPPERRLRARVMALEWLSERTGPLLAELKADAKEAETFAYALSAITAIIEQLDERAAGSEVNLLEMQRPLRKLAGESEALANPPKPAPPATGGAAAEGQPAAAAAGAADLGGGEIEPAFRQVTKASLSLARRMRKAKAWDQRAYALTRFASWIEILELPPAEGVRSSIPDPETDLKERIEGLLKAGEALDALDMAEAAFEDSILWFDAQRYIYQAMTALGERYLGARGCVIEGLAGLLLRFPKLRDMQFASGRPFADKATRLWISESVLPKADEAPPAERAAPDRPAAAIDAVAEAALKHAGEGRLSQGLALFVEGRRTAGDERERFTWDIAQARFCLEAGAERIAEPLLASLDQEIATRALETWDPALCSEALVLHYRALAQLPESDDEAEDPQRLQQSILKRLCRIDMVAAAGLAE
ncbi:MAG: type VI secretion system protein TssA [Pseudomonadota bacterium]